MRRVAALVTVALTVAASGPTAFGQTPDTLQALSLEELMEIEVSTVSRVPRARALVPAAVHVITQHDIRRSGATRLIELLRLVPGVHVARIDSNTWALGIRGFTDRLAKSMLVLIDGRAVYSPLFAGTYWEVQDYPLEDIERIEVIRGPGGTLWGANAVNGIVNIITKEARLTQGTSVTLGSGTDDRAVAGVRYGGTRGTLAYRAYGKGFALGPEFHADGHDFDDWEMAQGGFRADWDAGPSRRLTVQGDLYAGALGQRTQVSSFTPPFARIVEEDGDVSGGNLLARWTAPAGELGGLQLQAYYDRTYRSDPSLRETRHTFDVDFQHAVSPAPGHNLVWGLGYRITADDTESVQTIEFIPEDRTDDIVSAFVQDEIALARDRLRLTVGAKVEHNDYSGFEAQPSARLLWTPSPGHSVTWSVTRAVRTPSRAEHGLVLTNALEPPVFVRLLRNEAFRPEKLVAYEAGYIVRPTSWVALTAAAFFNRHDDLASTRLETPFVEGLPAFPRVIVPLQFDNQLHGNSHGVEISADVRPTTRWRWTAAYSLLRMQLTPDAPGADASQEAIWEGSSPTHQLQLQSSVDLPADVELDWLLRFVSKLPHESVPAYATSDVRLGWHVNRGLELAVVGRNLHHAHHFEFSAGPTGTQIQRAVYAQVTWRR